jgi:tetratricopeptide (TPR) repeat protein
MTEKQAERLRNKIKQIKKELAADKKFWGGYYHDGRGLRYIPPEYYIELEDYRGAKRYFNWFNKNFPDDICSPYFYFQWSFVLFQTGNINEAKNMIEKCQDEDKTILDIFFNKSDSSEYSKYFKYRADQDKFKDFGDFLKT